jgi:ATP-dependent DNA helicase RecG
LLTGSTKKKEKSAIINDLTEGKIHILIGTHAVIEPGILFKQFKLVIIDEQHRFGVEQKPRYGQIPSPHVIVMTATPIHILMSVYGDLDVSIIDQLPPVENL